MPITQNPITPAHPTTISLSEMAGVFIGLSIYTIVAQI